MRCLAHIVNLASEVFLQHSYFQHTAELISWIKSSLFKKPWRKAHFLKFLSDYIPPSEAKLPPEPDGIPGLRQLSTIPPEFTCMKGSTRLKEV